MKTGHKHLTEMLQIGLVPIWSAAARRRFVFAKLDSLLAVARRRQAKVKTPSDERGRANLASRIESGVQPPHSRKKTIHPKSLISFLFVLLVAGLNAFAQTNVTSAPPPVGAPMVGGQKVASSAEEDIHDIRGPKHMPWPWFWPVCLAGGAALLYAGWIWNRRRARTITRLPYQIALAKLEEARTLMQPEMAREFSIAVSEIVRSYIEERFQARAAHRTTEEFLHDLIGASNLLLTNYQSLLSDFLRHCDLAKFARWTLSVDEMERMYQSAYSFISETGETPKPDRNVSTTTELAHTQT